MTPSVLVVGGGFAGLAAALRLADRGISVRLVEKRPILGGRAYSVEGRDGGHAVDNGQHLLMGCYARALSFLDRIGATPDLEMQPRLRVALAHPVRGIATFASAPLPSPFHLSLGVMQYSHLSLAERARMLVGATAFVLRCRRGRDGRLGELTVAEALTRLGQREMARACFWNPLAIAVLNELPERASAALFAEVLRRVFFARSAASRIIFPRIGLSNLYAKSAARAIDQAGGTVETRRVARELVLRGERIDRLSFHDGSALEASAYVLAVPPPALVELLPEEARHQFPFAETVRLRSSPIVSVHLWFAERIPTPRMIGFLEGPIHWLFTPPMQPEKGRYVTLVSSGAHDLVERDPDEIVRIALFELSRYLPAMASLHLADSLVTKERAATFATTPAEQKDRPGTCTPIRNLFLAGDWTDTGLPATIESAVESGERAATAVARTLSERFIAS